MRQAWITKDYEETFGDDIYVLLVTHVFKRYKTYQNANIDIYSLLYVSYFSMQMLTISAISVHENISGHML